MGNANCVDEYIKEYPELGDCINEYIKENPQVIMVFEEVFQRAKLSQEEQIIFAKAIANYVSTIINFHIKEFLNELGY